MLLQQDLFCCEDVNISVFHTRFDDEPSFFVDSKSQNILVFKTLIRLRKISIYLRAVPPFYDSSQLLRLLQSCSYVTLRLSKFLESDFIWNYYACQNLSVVKIPVKSAKGDFSCFENLSILTRKWSDHITYMEYTN